MSYPSKWFDFTSHKEIKRLRKDINDTTETKIQITASVVVAILSLFLNSILKDASIITQSLVCAGLCLLAIVIFFVPFFKNIISLHQRANIIVDGKNAVALFDDEITYDVLTACEFFNSMNSIPENDLQGDIKEFYYLEISYYVTKSIRLLSRFTANYEHIIGCEHNQIDEKRMRNIIALIQELKEQTKCVLPNHIEADFATLCSKAGVDSGTT